MENTFIQLFPNSEQCFSMAAPIQFVHYVVCGQTWPTDGWCLQHGQWLLGWQAELPLPNLTCMDIVYFLFLLKITLCGIGSFLAMCYRLVFFFYEMKCVLCTFPSVTLYNTWRGGRAWACLRCAFPAGGTSGHGDIGWSLLLEQDLFDTSQTWACYRNPSCRWAWVEVHCCVAASGKGSSQKAGRPGTATGAAFQRCFLLLLLNFFSLWVEDRVG